MKIKYNMIFSEKHQRYVYDKTLDSENVNKKFRVRKYWNPLIDDGNKLTYEQRRQIARKQATQDKIWAKIKSG